MMMFGIGVHLVRKCMVDFLVTEAEPNDEGAGGGAVNSTRMGKVKTELKLVKPLTSWSQHLASFCLAVARCWNHKLPVPRSAANRA